MDGWIELNMNDWMERALCYDFHYNCKQPEKLPFALISG